MKKRSKIRGFLSILVGFSILAFALAGCGAPATPAATPGSGTPSTTPAPKGPVTITVAQGVDTESLEPANQAATPSKNIGFLMFDTLVERKVDMTIGPLLATSWTIVDDLTWEFKLRDDVTFHDGSKLTADDVVYTYTRLLNPDNKFRNTANVSMIDRAEKVDDYTVRIITKNPYAPLLSRLLFAEIVPKAYVEQIGNEEFNRKPIGSGPFKFVEWVRDQRVVMERNETYWRGPAVPDKVIFRTIPENSARLAALKTGEVDIIVNVTPDLIPELDHDPTVELAPVRSVRTMFVGMNIFTPPLDDVKVRQALNYAVDKQSLLNDLISGQAYYTGRMYGELIHGYDPSGSDYPYDPAKAKELLAEAGYPDGITLEFEAPRGRYMMDAEISEAIAAQLELAGIKTQLTVSDWGTFWPKTVGKNQKHLWFLGLGNTLMDADYYFNLYLSSKGRGYFHTPETDERIFAQQSIMDPVKRLAELETLTKDLEALAPWIFLWDQADLYAKRSNVTGWEPRSDERIDVFTATKR
jgi:peptide/nickel transport system substrate-binding protein